MNILIRPASIIDFPITENLTREAFWNIYKPGCEEHLILHNLRNSHCYIAELDKIATLNNDIIGHVITTKAKIVTVDNKEHEVLCVGPLSVAPSFQNKGVGSSLMTASIIVARELGFAGMILFGNPNYYHRFGFRNALEYGISTRDGENFEPFMALELQKSGFQTISGRFFEDDLFTVRPEELIEFEKQFSYKEKLVTDTQLRH